MSLQEYYGEMILQYYWKNQDLFFCGRVSRSISIGLFINREKQYSEKENSEEYEKVTKQRALERDIRKQKTTRNALKAAGDDEGVKEYDKKIRTSTAKLERFCDENGLIVRRDRTEVYGYSDPGRKKKHEDFVEALDKSEESGIIKSGSDIVALEEQRYGRNKNTLVNKTFIDSGEYKRKFDNATDNPVVNKSLYDCAKKALKHRSGTVFEDMYWINSNTGNIELAVTDSTAERGIPYSDKIIKAITGRTDLITLHTHPGSMPPSISDLNKNFEHNYRTGFIACHNGRVFGYNCNEEISQALHDLYVAEYQSMGYDEYSAQLASLNKLKENHDFDFWEVT